MKPTINQTKLSQLTALYGSLPDAWPVEAQSWYADALKRDPALAQHLLHEQTLDATLALARQMDAESANNAEDQAFALRLIQAAQHLPRHPKGVAASSGRFRLRDWLDGVFMPERLAWKPAFALAMTLLCSGFLLGQQAPLPRVEQPSPDILYQEEIW